MERKPRDEAAETRDIAAFLPGFPKKAAAAIKGVPAGVRGRNLPSDFLRVIKRAVEKMGPKAVADHAEIYSVLQNRWAAGPKAGSLVEELEQARKVIDAITRDNPTFSATVPIVLERRHSRRPELIGSGVLVRIVDCTFLLTAAHVTDAQSEGTLLIPGREGFIPANGYFSAMRMPASGRRSDDKLDVAYFLLDRECVSDLHRHCTVLTRRNVLLEPEPPLYTDYTFAGYPWRRSRAREGAVETDFTTLTGGEAKETEYEAVGLTRSRHIAIRVNRKQAFSQRLGRVVTPPLPQGMSGGGVYAWSQTALKEWPVRLPLAGIATEFIPDRSLLVATRLHVFVRCIFHNEPDLAAIAAG